MLADRHEIPPKCLSKENRKKVRARRSRAREAGGF